MRHRRVTLARLSIVDVNTQGYLPIKQENKSESQRVKDASTFTVSETVVIEVLVLKPHGFSY